MAQWRAAAIERMPDLKRLVEVAEDVTGLWSDLLCVFETAYSKPINEQVIAQIYAYADWCVSAPECEEDGRDPFSAVVVGFYESIPTIAKARDDMPRWFNRKEVKENRSVFSSLIGDDDYEKLLAYMQKHQKRYRSRP